MSIKDESFISDFTDFLERQGIKVNKEIFVIIRDYLKDNSDSDGTINLTSKKINVGSRKLLNDYFKSPSYKKFIRSFGTGFGRTLSSEAYIQKSLNNVVFSDSFLKTEIDPVLGRYLYNTNLLIGETGYKARLVNPVARALVVSVKKRYTLTEATKVVQSLTIGKNPIGESYEKGNYLKYAQQTARDMMFGFDGEVNEVIAESYGMTKYRFLGTKVSDTRYFCIHALKKKVIDRETYQDLIKKSRAQKDKASYLRKGSTFSNFARNRGGYNCRHRAVPIY